MPHHSDLTTISPHAWHLLVRHRFVDPRRGPQAQGYRVVDEAAGLPRGNVNTRFAITTSEITFSNKRSNGSTTPDEVEDPVPVSPPSISTSTTSNLATKGHKRTWTPGESLRLARLRAQKVPYKLIARQLDRTQKSCEIQFDRIKGLDRYRAILKRGRSGIGTFNSDGLDVGEAGESDGDLQDDEVDGEDADDQQST